MEKVLDMVFTVTTDNAGEEKAKGRLAQGATPARPIVLFRTGKLNRLSFFGSTIKDKVANRRLLHRKADFFVQTCAQPQ